MLDVVADRFGGDAESVGDALVGESLGQEGQGLGLAGSQRLDDEQGLRDAGLDSLMALELKNRLQASTGQVLPTTIAFDYPTTTALAGFVGELLGASIAEAPASAPADGASSSDLDAMSDDEAAALLADELAALNRARGTSSEYSRG